MEPSSDPGTALVLGEGHYNVVLAGAGHRTLEVPRAGPRTGAELADLATCIQVFATAVFDPSSPDTTVARGATAYAAVARSFDIGKPSGALEASKARNSRSGPRLRVVEGGDAPPAMSRNDAGRQCRVIDLRPGWCPILPTSRPRAGARSLLGATLAFGAAGWPVLAVAGFGMAVPRRAPADPTWHPPSKRFT